MQNCSSVTFLGCISIQPPMVTSFIGGTLVLYQLCTSGCWCFFPVYSWQTCSKWTKLVCSMSLRFFLLAPPPSGKWRSDPVSWWNDKKSSPQCDVSITMLHVTNDILRVRSIAGFLLRPKRSIVIPSDQAHDYRGILGNSCGFLYLFFHLPAESYG